MIYNSAYDTVFGSVALDASKRSEIEFVTAYQDYSEKNISMTTGLNLYYVSPFTDVEMGDQAPGSFKHPYIKMTPEKITVISDVRPFLNRRSTLHENKFISSNPTELNFVMLRAMMNGYFITDRDEFKYKFQFANTVYAAWISDTVSKRYGLDPEAQLKTFIIAYFFYMSLFLDRELTENDLLLGAKNAAIEGRCSASFAMDVAEKMPHSMKSISDMIMNIQLVTDNKRLFDLHIGTLATIVATTWYGTFSKDIIAVSLEHVPSFAAVVGISVTQRYYKKSMISTIAEAYGKQNKLENYIAAINHLLLSVNNPRA